MTAAIIAGAGATIGVALVILSLAIALRSAEQRAADARVLVAERDGQITVLRVDVDSLKRAVAFEKRRADAFDQELDQIANDGDAAGARARVLQRWQREDQASTAAATGRGDSAGGVRDEPAAAAESATQPDDDPLASRL